MNNHTDVQGLNYGMVPWEGGSIKPIKIKEVDGNIFERVINVILLACELGVVDESLMLRDDLLDYNSQGDEYISYPCRSCGEDSEVYDIENFDPDMQYCGRSPSCCP